MKELKKCVDLSIGPAFFNILGDKYGYRPFSPSTFLSSRSLLFVTLMLVISQTLLETLWPRILRKEIELVERELHSHPQLEEIKDIISKFPLHIVWDTLEKRNV